MECVSKIIESFCQNIWQKEEFEYLEFQQINEMIEVVNNFVIQPFFQLDHWEAIVSMEKINQERISLGYKDMDNDYPFVLKAYESKEKYNEATKLAVDSDRLIAGSTPTDDYIKERHKL